MEADEQQQAAFRKLSEAVRVFREEGGAGEKVGSMTAWSLVMHEYDFDGDVSCVSEWHEAGQSPAMTMGMLEWVYERYKNTVGMAGVVMKILGG